MALLEFSITPIGAGESLARYVAKAVDVVDRSGLDYRLHAMGTEVEGDLAQLLDVLRRATEAVAADCDRVTVSAKIDVRKGHPGALAAKVASVEKQLGRAVKK
jgi:uncharacterized protein (TIGR00106 family)